LKAPDENEFTNLLGLPSISIESLYQQYRENDQTILGVMREHSNFLQCYEGYPEFLTLLTHRSIIDRNRIWKAAPWSQEAGCLDFYQSLGFITQLAALLHSGREQLYQNARVFNDQLRSHIDT
jgi:hypothetical protein